MNFNAQMNVNTSRLGFLFSMLAKEFVNSDGRRLDELNKMMPLTDSKERAKIREKKLAHGQKEGADGNGTDDDVYDSQAAEGILTMLDYLISLGDQESEQVTEENTLSEESYDFDNAYAEYLDDVDEGYDDDLDDEDEEYFGLSMWAKRLAPCFAEFRPVCDLLEKGEKSISQNRSRGVGRLFRFVTIERIEGAAEIYP